MLRRLFTVASALSLLLCALVAILWLRGLRAETAWMQSLGPRYGNSVHLHDTYVVRPFYASGRFIILLALPPALWIIAFLRTKRKARPQSGLCRICGYDLRATADRCPECGTPVSAIQQAKLKSEGDR